MITNVVTRVCSFSLCETHEIGARLCAAVTRGDVISIDGDLGSGKTELVRGFVSSLASGVIVTSPTFSIVNTYESAKFPVYHFDFYRLDSADELRAIGFEEYIYGDGVCLIEWGSMFETALPKHTKHIFISNAGNAREITADFGNASVNA